MDQIKWFIAYLKGRNQQILLITISKQFSLHDFSIISSQRCLIEPTRFFITVSGILLHSSTINCSSSLIFLGIRFSTLPFTIAHKFSIGFKSGLLDGQSMTTGAFSSRKL